MPTEFDNFYYHISSDIYKSSFDLDFSQVFLIIKIVQIFLQDTATFFKGNGKGV